MTKKIAVFCISLLLICLSVVSITLAKYYTTANVGNLNLNITARTEEYSVPLTVNNSTVYARNSFSSGTVDEVENLRTSGNKNYGSIEIVEGEGLHITDTSTSDGYWAYIQFVGEDGYSTNLQVGHIYYTTCEFKIISIGDGGYFSFGLYNEKHENGQFGVKCIGITYRTTTNNEYLRTSVYGEITKHDDYTPVNSDKTYLSDYPDTLQFGSAATCLMECYVKNVMMLDLTQIFGEGNEPPKTWCDENINIETAQLEWVVNF